jgi:signal transduction histidine kinase
MPPVLGDAIQLQQVVLNLVHNAADAMRDNDEKRRTITITTSQPDAETVLVAVKDQGPPIDQATRDRMFDPFFTTRPDGMGMGLPISHTIIEAHGGTLWARRNPNRGLTVQFTIPALLD